MSRPCSRTHRIQSIAWRLVSPTILLVFWEIASLSGWIPGAFLAAPSTIAGTLWQMLASGELENHLLVSAERAMTGLSIGVLIAATLALCTGLSRWSEVAFDSPMQMLRTLPSLAIAPMFILWFGVGEVTKIAMIATSTVFPIYMSLFAGIRSVDPKLIEVAKVLGLRPAEIIWHIVLPGALPSFFVGLRYALGISWLALVVAEQINATSGIGYLANDARTFMRTDVIVICLLVYSLLGLTIDALVRALEGVSLAWRPSVIRT
jgi:sulfonate transport system permease protein